MCIKLQTVKTFLLALAIGVGLILQAHPARAQSAETAVLAGGCFWCVEADFEKVPGVIEVVSGYAGGTTPNPTYEQVTAGGTGHYEAVEITYNPAQVTYAELLRLFFRSVDPLDAGGQFCDRGDSYRTAVFVNGAEEIATAQAAFADAQRALGRPLATQLISGATFYDAEAYHQDYYKGQSIVLTRRGPKTQADAYAFYRSACGRDARVRALWGREAPFAG